MISDKVKLLPDPCPRCPSKVVNGKEDSSGSDVCEAKGVSKNRNVISNISNKRTI